MNLGKAAELLEEAEICLKLLEYKQLLGQVQAETALFEDEFAEEYAKLLRKLESDLARAGTASERERLKSAFVAACVALMAKLQVKRAGNAARAGWRGSEDDPEFDAMMLTLQDTWEASRLEGFEPRLNKAARAEPESLTQKLMAVGSYGMMFGGMVWSAFWKGRTESAPPQLLYKWGGTIDAATCADCLNRIGRVYTNKSLPGLPGDQSTACNGRCRCWLEESNVFLDLERLEPEGVVSTEPLKEPPPLENSISIRGIDFCNWGEGIEGGLSDAEFRRWAERLAGDNGLRVVMPESHLKGLRIIFDVPVTTWGRDAGDYANSVDAVRVFTSLRGKARTPAEIAWTIRHEVGHRSQFVFGLAEDRAWLAAAENALSEKTMEAAGLDRMQALLSWGGGGYSDAQLKRELFADVYAHRTQFVTGSPTVDWVKIQDTIPRVTGIVDDIF